MPSHLFLSRLSRGFTIVRGVIYSAGFVWLWTWLALIARTFDGRFAGPLPRWLRFVGYAISFGGALLAGTCIAMFVTRGRGTPAPFDPPRAFVASGPYRYVRNPMYIGAAAVILGAGLIVSSPSIVLLTFAFLVIMHTMVVVYEEPALSAKFGTSYLRYKSSVHRWILRMPN